MRSSFEVRMHDRFQLEIKAQYLSDGSQKAFETDVWLFLPPALGISGKQYSSQQFYADLRIYTRLKTPHFSFTALLSDPQSPLVQLESMMSEANLQGKSIRQELKLLGGIFQKIVSLEKVADNFELVQTLIERWRALLPRLLQRPLKEKTKRCVYITDEMMSNSWEIYLIQLYRLQGKQYQHNKEERKRVRSMTQEYLRTELAYRRECAYFVFSEETKEQYLFHYGNLTKYLSTVLFLESKDDRFVDWLRQMAFGVAAGLAMLWALSIQIFALIEYGVNLSQGMSIHLLVSFVGIGLFSYILKDRIKATSGNWLTAQLSKRVPDHKQQFYIDEEHKAIASISDRMKYLSEHDLSEEIQERYNDFKEWNPYFIFGSDILQYHRQVQVYPKIAKRQFARFQGVVEIYRFHVWNWVKTLDAPKKEISVLNEFGDIDRCKAPRVYIVNMLLRLREGSEERYQLYRLSLTSRGLVEIEEVQVQ